TAGATAATTGAALGAAATGAATPSLASPIPGFSSAAQTTVKEVKLSSKAIEALALVDFIAMTHPCFVTERIVSLDARDWRAAPDVTFIKTTQLIGIIRFFGFDNAESQ
ncbi:MAG: hypothetical protein P4M15_03905, partial [Alphaproteobacteria bacterium]|nr:hypothetical protein [Alphaproteobacteria bacterium]